MQTFKFKDYFLNVKLSSLKLKYYSLKFKEWSYSMNFKLYSSKFKDSVLNFIHYLFEYQRLCLTFEENSLESKD